MPVRRVSNRGGNIIGKFPALKLGRMVAFESLIERDYVYLLDYEQSVTWFDEQPLTITYQHEGKEWHYTPDFHVLRASRNELVECKPAKLTGTDENMRKFAAARAWCATHDWTFHVVTDQQIRANYYLENVKLLTYYARTRIAPADKARVFAALETTGATMGDIARLLSPKHPPAACATLLHMAFHHEISLPLDHAPLTLASAIQLPTPKMEEHR